jgi:hypothetical protein
MTQHPRGNFYDDLIEQESGTSKQDGMVVDRVDGSP